VIVRDLNVVRVTGAPNKAYPVLIVNSYTVLPTPVPNKFFQAISRRRPQVFESDGGVKRRQFPARDARWRRSLGLACQPNLPGSGSGEALNHQSIVTYIVINVNRY
jgi:hypothetical protein